jgi:hypothetical protein
MNPVPPSARVCHVIYYRVCHIEMNLMNWLWGINDKYMQIRFDLKMVLEC